MKRELDKASLAIAIIRCNDWVREVREVAQSVVERYLTPEHAEQLVELLPLVLHLRTCGRDPHDNLVDEACRLLRGGVGTPLLHQAVESKDPRVQRAAIHVAGQLGVPEGIAFFRAQLRHLSPIVRVNSFRELRSRLSQQEFTSVALKCLEDKAGLVRRKALLALCQHPPEEFDSLLNGLLFDGNRTVRWLAVDQLKRRFEQDPVKRTREHLSAENPSHLEYCLDTLAEHGSLSDFELACRFLAVEKARHRAAAVRAISRLGGEEAFDRIVEALVDGSPRVVKAARESLRRRSIVSIRPRLEELMDIETPAHIRRSAFSLLLQFSRLDALEYALVYLGDSDERIRQRARSRIVRCRDRFVHFYEKPSAERVNRLLRLVDQASGHLSSHPWHIWSDEEWLKGFLGSLLSG